MRVQKILALLSVVSVPSLAQELPPFFNNNDIDQLLPRPNLPLEAYRPQVQTPQLAPQPAADGPVRMQSKLFVSNIRIVGGSLYSLESLAQVYQPLTDREVSFAELIEATRSITQRYHADGYPLSFAFIPEQDFTTGTVTIVLVEGYIDKVEVSGELGAVREKLVAFAQHMQGERPLTQKTFERYSSLISTVPGVTSEVRVPTPTTTDGATTLFITSTRKPVQTQLSLNSSNRAGTQALVGGTLQALTPFAEQFSVSGLLPPGRDREHYWRADYSQLLGSDGLQVLVSAATYRARPHEDIPLGGGLALSQRKENQRYSGTLRYPLLAAPDRWWSVSGQLYAVDDQQQYRLSGVGTVFESETNIRAFALETEWREYSAQRLRILTAGLYQGLNGLGAKVEPAGVDKDFFRLRLSALQSDALTENWQGVLSATLYWSDDFLPESERAMFGGQNFARGYPVDQASGDQGWGVAYEVSYRFKRDESKWLSILQPYVVLDRAQTHYNHLGLPRQNMASAAFGLRFGDARYYNIAVEAAKPLADKTIDSHNRSWRFNLSFSYQL